jgi:hypothetical protein
MDYFMALGGFGDQGDPNPLPARGAVSRLLEQASIPVGVVAIGDRDGDSVHAFQAVVRQVHHAETAPDEIDIVSHGFPPDLENGARGSMLGQRASACNTAE